MDTPEHLLDQSGSSSQTPDERYDRLYRLALRYERGDLSDDDFAAQKRRILASRPGQQAYSSRLELLSIAYSSPEAAMQTARRLQHHAGAADDQETECALIVPAASGACELKSVTPGAALALGRLIIERAGAPGSTDVSEHGERERVLRHATSVLEAGDALLVVVGEPPGGIEHSLGDFLSIARGLVTDELLPVEQARRIQTPAKPDQAEEADPGNSV